MNHTFHTSCTSPCNVGEYGECINEMTQSPFAKDLGLHSLLRKHPALVDELKGITGLTTKKEILADWALSASSSFFQGKPCLFFRYSGIEYIYLDADDIDSMKTDDDLVKRLSVMSNLEEKLDNDQSWVSAKTSATRLAALVNFCKTNEVAFVEQQILLSSLFAYHTPHSSMVKKIDLAWMKGELDALLQ